MSIPGQIAATSEAGGTFTSEIEQALAECGNLLVVISQHSLGSPWITREISHFKAIDPDRPVIPLMLDATVDPDEIYEGLGLVTQLRLYESFLASLRELLRLLGRSLFPPTENRRVPDRRSEERRQHSLDRRISSIDIRLRVGLDNYVERSGRNLLEPMSRWREVGALVRLLDSEDSPLKSFSYAVRDTGEPVELNFTDTSVHGPQGVAVQIRTKTIPVVCRCARRMGTPEGRIASRQRAGYDRCCIYHRRYRG